LAGGYGEAEALEEGMAGGVEGVLIGLGIADGGYEEGEGFGRHYDGEDGF